MPSVLRGPVGRPGGGGGSRRTADRSVRADAISLRTALGTLVGPHRTEAAGVDWDWGFCDCPSAVRIGKLPVAFLRYAPDRRHPILGDVPSRNGLRGRCDDRGCA